MSKGAPECRGQCVLVGDGQGFGEEVPRKAISNFSLSSARQGQYGRRPKVEMPEKTASAYWVRSARINGHAIGEGGSTCVPPSPGIGALVLYHKLLCGPAIGF